MENLQTAFRLTVLGTRGSMPIEGKNFSRYGGATSCYKICAGNEEIYLDAGSGIVKAKTSPETRVTILLTHMHLDHVVGLPFFSALGETGRPIDIYAGECAGLRPEDSIDRLISPPFWPCMIKHYPANVNVHFLSANEVGKRFFIGEVAVDTIRGFHPNGAIIYRLTRRGKSIVYATDFEHSPEACATLADFAKGCDLLMYDAQYTDDEYDKYRGYGHSTPEEGLAVAERADVARLLLVHHAPSRTDSELDEMERQVVGRFKAVTFAKGGDEFLLQ